MDVTKEIRRFNRTAAQYDSLLVKVPNTPEGSAAVEEYRRLRASVVRFIWGAEHVFCPPYDLDMIIGRFDQEALRIFQA